VHIEEADEEQDRRRKQQRNRLVVERAVELAAIPARRRAEHAVDEFGETALSALFKNTEHIIGDSVSAITPDTITEPASVKANSRNSEPVRPPRKPIGAYTAASVIVMEMTGPTISRAPCSEACTGDLPSSRWRWMFSTTTIASSTTRPMASTIASSVSRLKLKPPAASACRHRSATAEW
jgi:hypothetical protein